MGIDTHAHNVIVPHESTPGVGASLHIACGGPCRWSKSSGPTQKHRSWHPAVVEHPGACITVCHSTHTGPTSGDSPASSIHSYATSTAHFGQRNSPVVPTLSSPLNPELPGGRLHPHFRQSSFIASCPEHSGTDPRSLTRATQVRDLILQADVIPLSSELPYRYWLFGGLTLPGCYPNSPLRGQLSFYPNYANQHVSALAPALFRMWCRLDNHKRASDRWQVVVLPSR